jgi:hypothetical protein
MLMMKTAIFKHSNFYRQAERVLLCEETEVHNLPAQTADIIPSGDNMNSTQTKGHNMLIASVHSLTMLLTSALSFSDLTIL